VPGGQDECAWHLESHVIMLLSLYLPLAHLLQEPAAVTDMPKSSVPGLQTWKETHSSLPPRAYLPAGQAVHTVSHEPEEFFDVPGWHGWHEPVTRGRPSSVTPHPVLY